MAKGFTFLAVLWIVGVLIVPATTQTPAVDPSVTDSTMDPSTENSTQPTTSPITPTPSIKPPGPCDSNPCKDGSSCQPRPAGDFVCLCLPGDSYNLTTKTCDKKKVFPGTFELNQDYVPSMANPTSAEFIKVANGISEDMKVIFSKEPKVDTILLQLMPVPLNARATAKVRAIVDIVFPATSKLTSASVKETVTSAVTTCPGCSQLKGSTFSAKSLCDSADACDVTSTVCEDKDGSYSCTCKEGYVKSPFSERVCRAPCPIDEQIIDGKCAACAFGYTGFNCQESWKLSLVIVSSVLGGLLLIAIILVAVFATKSPKKNSKKSKKGAIGSTYDSHPSAKMHMSDSSFANSQAPAAGNRPANFANAGVPRIPRATTNSGWDNRTNLEMTPSNSRQNLIPAGRNTRTHDDYDNSNGYIRPQNSAYTPSRPQNNPYSQNRPQANPYASNQGHTNPYFTEDNGRRFH